MTSTSPAGLSASGPPLPLPPPELPASSTATAATSVLLTSSCDEASAHRLGGKGASLRRLSRAGFVVPAWFVVPADCALDDDTRALIAAASAKLGHRLAVRSSANVEDGVRTSFAGQLDTFLNVAPDDVADAVARCRASIRATRALAYLTHNHIDPNTVATAVVVQSMVDARVAGVCFSANPDGARDEAVVVACAGLGTGVVDGTADTESHIASTSGKARRWRRLPGETTTLLDEPSRDAIVDAGERVHALFGRDVDVEWAIDAAGTLHLLQARPVTTLPEGAVGYFDRSNVGENYPGVTLPLTFSHLVESYEAIFRNTLRRLGVAERALQDHDADFKSLLGHVQGRVAYNTAHWYRLFRLIPGVGLYLSSWEEMLGVSREGDTNGNSGGAAPRVRQAFSVLRTGLKAARHLLMLDVHHRRFLDDVAAALAEVDGHDVEALDEHALIGLYRGLNTRLLNGWEITLLNDGFAFLFSSTARRLLAKTGAAPGVFFGLLADDEHLESIAPLKALLTLAARLRTLPRLRQVCEAGLTASPPAPLTALRQAALRRSDQSGDPAANADERAFVVEVDDFLSRWGDRCADELKFESRTFKNDEVAFARALLSATRADLDVDTVGRRERATRADAEREARRALAGRPLQGVLIRLCVALARRSIRWREASRLRRTQSYAAVRRLFRELGRRFEDAGALDDKDDVFALTTTEVLGFIMGTGADVSLKDVVERRKVAFARHRLAEPRERFRTRGVVGVHPVPSKAAEATTSAEPGVWRGVGCSAGIAEARAIVVRDARGSIGADDVKGRVLIAESTDPGWIFLMAAAAAVVVEKGSMLSHAAIVGRELGIPTVVGIAGATTLFRDEPLLCVDGATGTVRAAAAADTGATKP